jgi:hypothetical protein
MIQEYREPVAAARERLRAALIEHCDGDRGKSRCGAAMKFAASPTPGAIRAANLFPSDAIPLKSTGCEWD